MGTWDVAVTIKGWVIWHIAAVGCGVTVIRTQLVLTMSEFLGLQTDKKSSRILQTLRYM